MYQSKSEFKEKAGQIDQWRSMAKKLQGSEELVKVLTAEINDCFAFGMAAIKPQAISVLTDYKHLTSEKIAERYGVTRQAVSRMALKLMADLIEFQKYQDEPFENPVINVEYLRLHHEKFIKVLSAVSKIKSTRSCHNDV